MPAAPKVEFVTGYNRTTLANRVHDILTVVAAAKGREKVQTVNLVGVEKAGPWCLLARPLAGDVIKRTVADANAFSFEKVTAEDENYQPSALRFGGLWPLAAAGKATELMVLNGGSAEKHAYLTAVYEASGAKEKLNTPGTAGTQGSVDWLGR
jgi:hypothetical protein